MTNENRYSIEAIDELIAWFNNQPNLPESLELESSINIPNLKITIDGMAHMCLANNENLTFRPCIDRFYNIKQKLQEQYNLE